MHLARHIVGEMSAKGNKTPHQQRKRQPKCGCLRVDRCGAFVSWRTLVQGSLKKVVTLWRVSISERVAWEELINLYLYLHTSLLQRDSNTALDVVDSRTDPFQATRPAVRWRTISAAPMR